MLALTRSGLMHIFQLDKCGEHGAVLILPVEGPELAEGVEVAGLDTFVLFLHIYNAFEYTIDLTLKHVRKSEHVNMYFHRAQWLFNLEIPVLVQSLTLRNVGLG